MNDFTLVTFLLDKSGSMGAGIDSTIEAFNAYLDRLKIGDDEVQFTLLQFDTVSIERTIVNAPVKDAPALSRENYHPQGGTPLIDAVCKTIKAIERQLDGVTPQPKVVVCIQTDGEENASREFTWGQLQDLVKEKTAAGWQFIFMGASIDAYKQASKMGVPATSTVSYDASDRAATHEAFAFTAMNTRNYSGGLTASASYTTAQKAAAGDKFDNWVNKRDATTIKDTGCGATPAPATPAPAKPIVEDFDL